MILDSVEGHGETSKRLRAFLSSSSKTVELIAAGRCPLHPRMEPLRALRMLKTGGPIRTEELPGGIIQISGRPELLARYVEAFAFEPGTESDHRHPEYAFMGLLDPKSASIIIEVDDEAGTPP